MNFDSLDMSFLPAGIDPWYVAEALAFLQVVFIDLVMAGDNAVAVGVAASRLEPDKRRRAIVYGVIGAVVIRIGFVLVTVELLKIVGLLLAGGLLLLWVCWKMWRELRHPETHHDPSTRPAKTLFAAVTQILIADVTMSLDNVLAVTGAAENHIWVLAIGLLFSIAAMGFAASIIAGILHKYLWIGYIGVVVVLFVALKMIWEGGLEIWTAGKCDMSLRCGPFLWGSFVHWLDGLRALIPVKSQALLGVTNR